MEAAAASTEISILAWSVILLLAHLALQAVLVIRDGGRSYALGPRDEEAALTPTTARVTRALRNFLETYAAFVGLALALAVTGKTGGNGAIGAHIWFWARIVYIPLFVAGIPVARTLVWGVSVIGLVLMLGQLMA